MLKLQWLQVSVTPEMLDLSLIFTFLLNVSLHCKTPQTTLNPTLDLTWRELSLLGKTGSWRKYIKSHKKLKNCNVLIDGLIMSSLTWI